MTNHTIRELHELYVKDLLDMPISQAPDFEDWLFDNGYLEDDDDRA